MLNSIRIFMLRIDDVHGILLANDQMGISVFDLFGKMLTLSDMRNFLRRNSVDPNDYETTAALAIRCFLVLLDSKDQSCDPEVLPLEIPIEPAMVKAEIMEGENPEPIEIINQENNDQEFYMAIPTGMETLQEVVHLPTVPLLPNNRPDYKPMAEHRSHVKKLCRESVACKSQSKLLCNGCSLAFCDKHSTKLCKTCYQK